MADSMNTTQFMTSVISKLRNANQVANSNNLNQIVSQGSQSSPANAHKTIMGTTAGNRYKEDFVKGFGNENGLITDPDVREGTKAFLTAYGTVVDVVDEITYGATKVAEGIVDGFVGLFGWIGTWFGADDQWAKDFISVDCSRYVAEATDFVLGGWATELAFGETMAEQSAFNFIDDQEVQNKIRFATDVVGEAIPQIVLAIFTAGTSLAFTVPLTAGASAFGQSIESEVLRNPEVNMGRAVGYGAIKGTIAAGMSAIMMGTGASAGNNAVGTLVDKAGAAVLEKTGSTIAAIGTKIAIKGGSAYLEAQAATLIDPVLRQITVDDQALYNAYGDNEKVKRTLEESAKNGALAATISAGFTAVQESIAVQKAGGLDKYGQQMYDRYMLDKNPELKKSIQEVSKYNDQRTKICNDLANGKITEDEFITRIEGLDKNFETAMAKYEIELEYYQSKINATDVKQIGELSKGDAKFGSAAQQNVLKNAQGVYNAAQMGEWLTDSAKESFKQGNTFEQFKARMTMKDAGSVDVSTPDAKPQYLAITAGNTEVAQVPTNVTNGKTVITPKLSQISTIVMASANKQLPVNTIQLPQSLNVFENGNNLNIESKAITSLIKSNEDLTPKEVTTAIKDIKNVSMISESPKENEITLISKKYDDNGKVTYNTYLLDTKNHTIKNISIADKKPDNAVHIKPSELAKIDNANVVKMAANSVEGKVASFKSTTDVIKHTKNLISKQLKEAGYEIDVLHYGDKDLPRVLFNDINLNQNYDSLHKVVHNIFSAQVKMNGITYELKDLLPNSTLTEYKKSLFDDLKKMIEAKSTPTKMSQMIESYNKKIESLIAKIDRKDRIIDLTRQQISELKDQSIAYRNATIEVNRAIQNMELTINQYKVDKRLYKSEIENNGTIKKILSSLPRKNMIISKKGNIRLSDTQGLYLSDKYSQWAKDTIGSINELIEKGAFVNLNSEDLLSQFEILAYDGDPGVKHLNIPQLQALTNIMKMLRFQVSDKANQIRAERREVSKTIYKEQSTVNSLLKQSDSKVFQTLSNMGYDNVKLMFLGDMITGYDGSELQSIIDKLTVEDRENYLLQKTQFQEKYLATDDINKLGKAIKGSIKFRGHKVKKYELLSLYEQLSDSETLELFSKKGNYIEFSNKVKIYWSEDLFDDVKETLGISITSLDDKAIINGIYNYHGEDSYIPKVQKWQIDHKGFTTIPDRNDYVPRNQGTFNQRNDTVASLDTNEAKQKATTNQNIKERTQTGGKLVLKAYNPIEKASTYLDKMNKTLTISQGIDDFLSYFELNVEEDGVTYKAKELYGDKMQYIQDLARVLDNQDLSNNGFISKLQGNAASATLGLKLLFGPVKNFLSLGKQMNARGVINTLKALNPVNLVKDRGLAAKIKKTGTWQQRYADGIVNALTNTTASGKWAKTMSKLSFMYEVFDKATSLLVANTDMEYVKATHPELSKAEQEDLAVKLWIRDINATQSTAERFGKSPASLGKVLGHKSELVKGTFAFQSDTIAGSSMVIKDLTMAAKSKELMKNAKKIMDSTTATDAEKEAAKNIYDKAKKTQKRLSKAIPAGAAALLVGAVLKYIIDDTEQKFKGKKQWSESIFSMDSIGDILGNTAESFVPFFSTVYSAIKYNSGKTDLFALGAINDVLGAISDLINGKTQRGMFELLFGVTKYLGIPVKNLYNDIVAVTNMFDPTTAIKMNNLLYGTSQASNIKSFSTAVKNGDDRNAKAYLTIILDERIGQTTDAFKNEFLSLYKTGSITLPKSSMESYTDAEGKVITLNEAQKTTFRNAYSKANSMVDKLLKNALYKDLTDEEKSKVINKIYNSYYNYAFSKVNANYVPTSKMDYVMAKTDGNFDVTSVSSALTYINDIEPTKRETKKQLAIKYVNKLPVEKGMKLLILKLAGYGLSESESSRLKSYLKQKGMTLKEAKEFLK